MIGITTTNATGVCANARTRATAQKARRPVGSGHAPTNGPDSGRPHRPGDNLRNGTEQDHDAYFGHRRVHPHERWFVPFNEMKCPGAPCNA